MYIDIIISNNNIIFIFMMKGIVFKNNKGINMFYITKYRDIEIEYIDRF